MSVLDFYHQNTVRWLADEVKRWSN